ncbi:A disintegrin and metalloproteinase with thrombospondin motifs like [Epargyreus clarus]|uniref:A disintegrin and metalloproteinase with thrombospondin motifs like n=1 Tax=Epargyreus clarus TaxID=520877 RepID=UPI003C2ECD7E
MGVDALMDKNGSMIDKKLASLKDELFPGRAIRPPLGQKTTPVAGHIESATILMQPLAASTLAEPTWSKVVGWKARAKARVPPQVEMIHEHMTAAELQQVFQVEHHTHVPQYHPVQLTHHISRRNVPIDHPANTRSRKPERSNHHAANVLKTVESQQSLKNDEVFIKGKQYIKDMIQLNNKRSEQFVASSPSENIGDGSNGDEIQDKEHAVDEQETDVHKIELEAFGKQMKLVLKKQEGLVSKDGLRLWRAIRDESHPLGVAYEEINSEGEEEIGDLYHDDENGAALLIRRHPKHKSLLVEGSIGNDLVIKAIPDSMTAAAQKDEGFMYSSRMANVDSMGANLAFGKRESTEQERLKLALRGAQHVIIKRNIVHNNTLSDYAFIKPSHVHKKVKRNSNNGSNTVPDTVYPEILVFADYEEYA